MTYLNGSIVSSVRNRDKKKDDAIAQLSEQVMALTARMQDFERKQQISLEQMTTIIFNKFRALL